MNAAGFDEMVEKRADQQVQDRIKAAKKVIMDAVGSLLDRKYRPNNWTGWNISQYEREIFKMFSEGKHGEGWPKILWEREEKVVRDELFSVMDVMQKAITTKAPDKNDKEYCKPKPE